MYHLSVVYLCMWELFGMFYSTKLHFGLKGMNCCWVGFAPCVRLIRSIMNKQQPFNNSTNAIINYERRIILNTDNFYRNGQTLA